MSDSWPSKVRTIVGSLTSQTFANASQAPETNMLFAVGADEIDMTSPLWSEYCGGGGGERISAT